MTAFIEAASPHVMNTYGRVPIALSHGQGCRVWDVNGKQYLDALGGIAVNTLGHNHAKLVPALQDQIGKIMHSSNYYHVPGQEQLAARLVEREDLCGRIARRLRLRAPRRLRSMRARPSCTSTFGCSRTASVTFRAGSLRWRQRSATPCAERAQA